MSILKDLTFPQLRISEFPDRRIITFPIAGYSKTVKGILVQENHQKVYLIFSKSLKNKEKGMRAASMVDQPLVNIKLVPEPDNQYDPLALLVYAYYNNGEELGLLGYVPGKINKIIHKNLFRFEKSWVYDVVYYTKGKYCISHIALSYVPDPNASDQIFYDRLLNIMDDE